MKSDRTRCPLPNALRSALREDPDVILVGEMRDLETIRLALTGGRNRPPGVRYAAHIERGQDNRPYRRRLPGGRKGNGSFDALRVTARGHLADVAQDQGWRWVVLLRMKS